MKNVIKGFLLFPSAFDSFFEMQFTRFWVAVSLIQGLIFAGLISFSLFLRDNLLLAAASLVILAVFWSALLHGLLEPLLTRIIGNGMTDEQEFHWRRLQRDNNRTALLCASSGFFFIYLLLSAITLFQPEWSFWLIFASSLWSVAFLSIYLRRVLNFPWFFSIALPAFLTSTAFLVLPLSAYGVVTVGILAVFMAALSWISNQDIRHRVQLAERLKDDDWPASAEDKAEMVELVVQCGSRRLAERCLDRIFQAGRGELDIPLTMRLLSNNELYMEALDLGLEWQQALQEDAGFHLAMSEASFGARDPENAVSHAEEALDLAGGIASVTGREAHLFRALACFNEFEQMTAIVSCERIIYGPEEKDLRSRRILREARILLSKFSNQNAPEELPY